MSKVESINEKNTTNNIRAYSDIISVIRSPLSLFGLAMLICNAIFSLSAAWMKDLQAFIYAIHAFLGIVAGFVMIAIWSPRSLYHPQDLEGLSREVTDSKSSKIAVTIALFLVMFSYMGYQIFKIYQKR